MRSPFMAISEEDKNLNISLKSVKSGGRQVIYNSGYGEGNSHNLNLWECENLKKKGEIRIKQYNSQVKECVGMCPVV